ncbi:hypothetical protein NQ314_011271 [Rhamnusium bicolor]|uniref:Uncharacterized protein n=1 Tax=Rhamnusium bicolor TaxID=1586634 RepID=A0AAV8XKH7_9CUCU|nr:hypothetical protein NQ314_011271 [Rhamnusium bicolor]
MIFTKENVVHPRPNRFARLSSQRQSVSMVALDAYQPKKKSSSEKLTLTTIYDSEETSKTPVKDVKLEPIKCKIDITKKTNGILTMPSENIKNRLSSASTPQSRGSVDFSLNNDKEHSSGSEISLDTRENSADSEKKSRADSCYKFESSSNSSQDNKKQNKSRSTSSTKLEKLSNHLDDAIQKATENSNEEFEKKLGTYCAEIVGNVRNCSDRLEAQKESLRISKDDTNCILETFQKTVKIESKLKNSLLNFENSDNGFLNDILSEELKFQMSNKDNDATDTNGNVTNPEHRVKLAERKRLLATLKAIDNGENIDSMDNSPPPHRQTNLMHEILGDMSK